MEYNTTTEYLMCGVFYMKKLKKIFTLLLTLPLICLCFVGCSKNKEISLTNDNIKDYVIFNYSYVNENASTSNSDFYIFTIETTKKMENVKFENVKFTFNLIKKFSSSQYKYGNVEVNLDYNGFSKFSFKVYSEDNSFNNFKDYIKFEITEVTGSVIVKN